MGITSQSVDLFESDPDAYYEAVASQSLRKAEADESVSSGTRHHRTRVILEKFSRLAS